MTPLQLSFAEQLERRDERIAVFLMFLHMHMSGVSGTKYWGTTGTVVMAAEVRLERETCSQILHTQDRAIDWLGMTRQAKTGALKPQTLIAGGVDAFSACPHNYNIWGNF